MPVERQHFSCWDPPPRRKNQVLTNLLAGKLMDRCGRVGDEYDQECRRQLFRRAADEVCQRLIRKRGRPSHGR